MSAPLTSIFSTALLPPSSGASVFSAAPGWVVPSMDTDWDRNGNWFVATMRQCAVAGM
ncbi:MAG: hypothetical protein R3F10_01160 [Lysobacteraceae bacterium]